jgi:hypothetical protein
MSAASCPSLAVLQSNALAAVVLLPPHVLRTDDGPAEFKGVSTGGIVLNKMKTWREWLLVARQRRLVGLAYFVRSNRSWWGTAAVMGMWHPPPMWPSEAGPDR